MPRISRHVAALVAALSVPASFAAAQQPAAIGPHPGDSTFAPKVGQPAPDFKLPGATRFGLLKDSVHLADYRGQVVVLAFFPKARTKG